MSTLWTPGGERPVGRGGESPRTGPPDPEPAAPAQGASDIDELDDDLEGLDPEEARARLEELRSQLMATPAAAIVANHCLGLFELASLHLSMRPPNLDEAKLAIDAFAAIVEGLPGRLGEEEPHLKEGLAQIRLAFVQIRAAHEGGEPTGPA